MPAKDLRIPERVRKRVVKLPLKIQERVIKSLVAIKTNPLLGTKLHGQLGNYYKLRLGDYRIVYYFDTKKSMVVIVKIEHHHGVYK